ncbi:MAG: hypothetical protein KDA28_03880 [Phycisphaerales bacterium]|nr:hypothetical protein [Phycisphaerales bacterium]
MGAISRHLEEAFAVVDWQPDVAARLDEHHLVSWSGVPARRIRFASSLSQFLETQRDTEVIALYGQFIEDLDSFCAQIERAIPGGPVERRIDGPRGLTALLRQRNSYRHQRPSRYRYYIWHDADVLLKKNHRLFGRIVESMAGVAAESEYVSDDLLLIHRAVFVGGPLLDVYAEDPQGQFNAWCDDGLGEPFWRVVTGIEAPRTDRFQIDELDD